MFNNEIILGFDERKHVSETAKPPFRWICSLEVQFPEPVINALGVLENTGKQWHELQRGDKGCGSGLLISPRHILTASHVLMGLKIVPGSKPTKKMLQSVLASQVKVIPGRNDSKPVANPFGVWTTTNVHVNPIFKKRLSGDMETIGKKSILKALPYDVAIIELNSRIDGQAGQRFHLGDKIGWWGKERNYQIWPVTQRCRKNLSSYSVHIGGFPGEKGHKPCSLPYTSEGEFLTTSPMLEGHALDLLLYQADTSAGMSGSPVWVENSKADKYLIGVHTSFSNVLNRQSGKRIQANVGVLITTELLRLLRT